MGCRYQWTRDSAIVMRTVVDSYISGNMTMRPLLDEYVEASYRAYSPSCVPC